MQIITDRPQAPTAIRTDLAQSSCRWNSSCADGLPLLAPGVRRQMRFNAAKLLLRLPKMVPTHQGSLSRAVNHKPQAAPTLYGSDPNLALHACRRRN